MNKKRYLELRNGFAFKKHFRFLLQHLLIDAALIALIAGIAKETIPLFTVPFIAILMFRNFGLMHDASHGAVHGNRLLNDAIGLWTSVFCLLPFEPWKKNHVEHHFWTGNIEKDPVSALRVELPKVSPRLMTLINFSWNMWLPLIGALQNLLFWRLSLVHWKKKRDLRTAVSLFVPLMVWGSLIVFLPNAFLLGALLPGLALYYLANEIVNMPHHLQLPILKEGQRLPIWEQYNVARSCLYPKWFAHYFVLNFNYHAEHHMFPEVPWYYLSDIHDVVKNEIGDLMYTDDSFSWTLENRPLSLVEVITQEGPSKSAVA